MKYCTYKTNKKRLLSSCLKKYIVNQQYIFYNRDVDFSLSCKTFHDRPV